LGLGAVGGAGGWEWTRFCERKKRARKMIPRTMKTYTSIISINVVYQQ
jgi:hypothetical protein